MSEKGIKKFKCRQSVRGEGGFGSFNKHRCSFDAVKDGYCTIHHPDYVRKVSKAVARRQEEARRRSPEYKLRMAREEIEVLKKKNKKLRKKLKTYRAGLTY